MLILDGIATQCSGSVRTDEYSPLIIKFDPQYVLSIDDIFYWRATNKTYLLEITIFASSGTVAEVNLVLIPNERIVRTKLISALYHKGKRVGGLPRFQVMPWATKTGSKEMVDPYLRTVDEHCAPKFVVGDDGVAILFEPFSPEYIIENHHVGFIFNSLNELCGVTVEDWDIGEAARAAWIEQKRSPGRVKLFGPP